jgi:hypothetical protein
MTLNWETQNTKNLNLIFGISTEKGIDLPSPSGSTDIPMSEGTYTFNLYAESDQGYIILDSIQLEGILTDKKGDIWASDNFCTIASGEDSCWTSVIWATENVTSEDEVTLVISSEGGIRVEEAVRPSGSYGLFLRDDQGKYKAELRINSQAVDEVILRALTEDNYPVGNLKADPNPCVIPEGDTKCSIRREWSTQNTEGLILLLGVHTEKSDILLSTSGEKNKYFDDNIYTYYLFAGIDPDYITLDSLDIGGVVGAPTGIPTVNILDFQILSNNFGKKVE